MGLHRTQSDIGLAAVRGSEECVSGGSLAIVSAMQIVDTVQRSGRVERSCGCASRHERTPI
jgi:hypothetical protein